MVRADVSPEVAGDVNGQQIGDHNTQNNFHGGTHYHRNDAPWVWPRAHDFTGYLEEKRTDFVGRQELFARVDAWRADAEGARALLVLADFGVGKTAFAAELVARKQLPIIAHHFCHADEDLTLKAGTFVATVAAQLATNLHGYREHVESDLALQKKLEEVSQRPGEVFSQAVVAPLWKLPAPTTPVVLLVDALDETLEGKRDDPQRTSIVALLAQHAGRLPAWLRILATSRNREPVTKPLRQAFATDLLDAESEANLDDLRAFVLERCREPALAARLAAAEQEPRALADALVAKSGGKFLYVVRILPEFTRAIEARSLADFDSLPWGMDAFYAEAFARRFCDVESYRAKVAPVLGVLCVQREAMARAELAEIVDLKPRDVAEICQQVDDFLRVSKDHRAAFDHLSLAQWLTEEDPATGLARAGELEIDKAAAEALLRAWALRRLEATTAHASSYLARHLPAHLPSDALPVAYRAALFDVRWLQSRMGAVGAHGLLADLGAPLVQHDELRLLGSAIRLSSHVLGRRPEELPAQLVGRLMGSAEPDLAALAERAREALPPPALAPRFACLGAPGGPLLRTFEGHTSWVNSVAFSPDGARALSGSLDATLNLWDVASGQLLRTLEGHTSPVASVAFSPDGARALSGSYDKTLKLWDSASGQLFRTFTGHSDWILSVAYSADGARALSGSDDQTFKLWDTNSGQLLRTLEGHTESVNSVAFSPNGARALSGSLDHTVKLWDTDCGQLLHTLEGHTDSITSVTFGPDGTSVLSGSDDQTLKLWDTETGQLLHTFEGHTYSVTSVAFSPDGARALSGSGDTTLRLWDTASGQLVRTFEGHTSTVASVAFSPDGARALSGSLDHTLKLWDTASEQLDRTIMGHTNSVSSVALSPRGTRALSASSGDSNLKLWDSESGELLRTFEGSSSVVTSVAFSPDGARALSSSADNTLKLWDIASGQLLQTWEEQTGAVTSVAFSPDGARALSGSHDGTVKVWNTASGLLVRAFEGHTDKVSSVAFSPDGARALSGSWDTTLKLWDIASGQLLANFDGPQDPVSSVTFSPDGARALSGSYDYTLKLWDTYSGRLLRTFEGHASRVTSVAFSTNGARALSGSDDCTLKLWGTRQGSLLASYTLDGAVNAVALSRDGRLCMVGTAGGRVCFLEVRG